MFKFAPSSFISISLLLLLYTGCSNYDSAMKTLPSELSIADQCTNSNRQFEIDCYELIAYKNSFAQLRLGLNAQNKSNYTRAIFIYSRAKIT